MLIQSARSSEVQRKILLGWEGEIREKIDFRFAHTPAWFGSENNYVRT